MPKKFLFLVSIVYTMVLVIASLINLHAVPSLGSSFDDKIYHLLAYFILAFLWTTYFRSSKKKYIFLLVFGSAVLLGYVLELLQYTLNPNRSYDTLDFIANSIGAMIGTLIASRINVFKLK